MQIIYEKDLKSKFHKKTATALGSFEALHSGHIEIIKKAVSYSKNNNCISLISIFKEPILKTTGKVSETLDERLSIIENLGVDVVVILDFNDEFKKIEYTDFFNEYILNKFNSSAVFVGFNYCFGHNALGNTKILSSLCKNNNIYLEVLPPVSCECVISSTYIHKLIENGDVEKLNHCLSRPYSIRGTVERGRHLGSSIGFPTANISFPKEKAILLNGVYFGKAEVLGKNYYSIINVGNQPTVTNCYTPKIEVFIIDFNEDIYGCKIKIDFLKKIRDIKKFSSMESLKIQLEYDLKIANDLIKKL